jgi:uncharacterized protein YukE
MNATVNSPMPVLKPANTRATRDLVKSLHDLRRQLDQMTETYQRHGWAGGHEVFYQARQETFIEAMLIETELQHRYQLDKAIAQVHADVEAAMAMPVKVA